LWIGAILRRIRGRIAAVLGRIAAVLGRIATIRRRIATTGAVVLAPFRPPRGPPGNTGIAHWRQRVPDIGLRLFHQQAVAW
jgi:hypothetical protein